MDQRCQCVRIHSSDLPLHIPLEWLIRSLVLNSMLLQLFLVVCGARRHLSSSAFMRFIVWVAYLSADAVAISALGIMMHSAQSNIYGVWAPMLLLHLGGPDSITAYSTADNELWLRHGFILIYQVVVAAYVMYLSALQGYLLAAAIVLFIVGVTKYAERTLALRFASYREIVKSTQPVYKFMQHEEEIDKENNTVEYNYLVMGEQQFQDKLKERESKNAKTASKTWKFLLNAKGIVTIKNVWEQEGLQLTDNYILCLSFALFKMYSRRFVSLYFHEGVRPKTRRFFFNERLPYDKIFKIVEMELKFMYDVLFSKSSGTAFSKWGALLRLLNTCLLGVAGFLLFFGMKVRAAQRTVTYVLISVALCLEVIQLFRIAVSDWTMVRLHCAYIQLVSRPSNCGWYMFKLIQIAMRLLGKVRKRLPDKYWKRSIKQYCVIEACLTSRCCMRCTWFLADCIPMLRSFIVPLSIKLSNHIKEQPLENEFREFIFQKLKEKCSPDQDIAKCRERVYGFDEYLTTVECPEMQWASELDLEDLILTWHIATTILDKASGTNAAESKNLQFSRTMSEYCAYLLVSRPGLLPLHADIAKLVYIEAHEQIRSVAGTLKDQNSTLQLLGKSPEEYLSDTTTLGKGTRLARQLWDKPDPEVMWEILAGYWAGLLIYMAVYNKAPLHAECLAGGGEFLSQLWALLGHMGCGEQSDTAVTKKREEKSKKEKEEEEKSRRREEDISKDEEKKRKRNRRIQERRTRARKEEEQNRKREEVKNNKLDERLQTMIQNP